MAKEKRELIVHVSELAIGMRVVRLDRPWLQTDFPLQGLVIGCAKDIDDLQRQCEYVYIEASNSFDINTDYDVHPPHTPPPKQERRKKRLGLFARLLGKKKAAPASPSKSVRTHGQALCTRRPPPAERVVYQDAISVEKELPKAKINYEDAKKTVNTIIEEIRLGKSPNVDKSISAASDIVDSVIRNKDALLWLTKLKHQDEYTAEHSLNVCVLTSTFARFLGHSDDEIRQLAISGLLHDVGKSRVPLEILNKSGRFTDEEYEIMKLHTVYGRDMLMSISGTDRIAVDVAHSHHERVDGNGYPRGLKAHQIPYYAKVVALVDCYDAITSNRCYDAARASMEALDVIYRCKGTHFDEELALEFIKCIGLYPPGAIVELSTGHVGIIISTHDTNKLRPKILVVRDTGKQPCRERVHDLSDDDTFEAMKIMREIPNGTHGVDIRDYLARGLVLDTASLAR